VARGDAHGAEALLLQHIIIHTMCVLKERPRPLVSAAQPHGWETRSGRVEGPVDEPATREHQFEPRSAGASGSSSEDNRTKPLCGLGASGARGGGTTRCRTPRAPSQAAAVAGCPTYAVAPRIGDETGSGELRLPHRLTKSFCSFSQAMPTETTTSGQDAARANRSLGRPPEAPLSSMLWLAKQHPVRCRRSPERVTPDKWIHRYGYALGAIRVRSSTNACPRIARS
jgi:hypothetical protein